MNASRTLRTLWTLCALRTAARTLRALRAPRASQRTDHRSIAAVHRRIRDRADHMLNRRRHVGSTTRDRVGDVERVSACNGEARFEHHARCRHERDEHRAAHHKVAGDDDALVPLQVRERIRLRSERGAHAADTHQLALLQSRDAAV